MITAEKYSDSDLAELLKEKTEQKPENTQDHQETTTTNDTPAPNKNDFEKSPEPVNSMPANREEYHKQMYEYLDRPKPTLPPLTDTEAEHQADGVIAFVDGLSCLTLPYLYQKSIFDPGEMLELKQIKLKLANSKKDEVTWSSKEMELSDRYDDYLELKENIEFTKEEVELLKNPLKKVFQKYNMHIGPEMMLATAAMTVMAPRLLPLFSRFERKL